MNYEQKIFEKVIKARRHREWRLANPDRNKIKEVKKLVEIKKVGWWKRLLRFLGFKI